MSEGRSGVYESIGSGYSAHRRPDPRIGDQLSRAIGAATSVVDIGAGTGSYEPEGRFVVAVEPSGVMIAQRREGAAPTVRATAAPLPFRDAQFDVAMAILTTHHWPDVAAGLREMKRVSVRQLVLTWDPATFADRFWLVRDYLPEAAEQERGLGDQVVRVAETLETGRVQKVVVAHDCADGFFGAYWRRPEAYLDPEVRAAISGLALLDQQVVAAAMLRLEEDLASGAWRRRQRDLLDATTLDLGYRLIVAG